jgi:beta-galactosidase
MIGDAGVPAPLLSVPAGVEVCRREGPGREAFILVNFSGDAAAFTLPRAMTDVLNGGETARIALPRYGVAVLLGPR